MALCSSAECGGVDLDPNKAKEGEEGDGIQVIHHETFKEQECNRINQNMIENVHYLQLHGTLGALITSEDAKFIIADRLETVIASNGICLGDTEPFGATYKLYDCPMHDTIVMISANTDERNNIVNKLRESMAESHVLLGGRSVDPNDLLKAIVSVIQRGVGYAGPEITIQVLLLTPRVGFQMQMIRNVEDTVLGRRFWWDHSQRLATADSCLAIGNGAEKFEKVYACLFAKERASQLRKEEALMCTVVKAAIRAMYITSHYEIPFAGAGYDIRGFVRKNPKNDCDLKIIQTVFEQYIVHIPYIRAYQGSGCSLELRPRDW